MSYLVVPTALALTAGFLALWRGWRAPATFLLAVPASDLLRAFWAAYVLTWPGPYTGWGRVLFLVDLAVFFLPPAALLWALGKRGSAVAFGALAWGVVAGAYPALRGMALVRYAAAVHLAAYAAAVAVLVWRGMWREHLTREELVLLLPVLSGASSVVLVLLAGIGEWWGTWIVNGGAYLAAAIVAALPPQAEAPQR